MAEEDKQFTPYRRNIVTSAALIPVVAIKSAAQSAAPVFTPSERRILEAFMSRLIPQDEHEPGAVECGAASSFKRQLTEDLSSEKDAVLEGLAAMDAFTRHTHGSGLADLAPDKQDAVLTALPYNQATGFAAFFNRRRRLTLEGTFGDPYYGGNKGFAGWDLIRYPGARLAVSLEQQKMAPIKPAHVSAWGRNHGH
jgi:gluconate 2-dehydrogenase gamma chain